MEYNWEKILLHIDPVIIFSENSYCQMCSFFETKQKKM